MVADAAAFERALRPKPSKLAANVRLRDVVADKLDDDWSPQQIAQWPRREFGGGWARGVGGAGGRLPGGGRAEPLKPEVEPLGPGDGGYYQLANREAPHHVVNARCRPAGSVSSPTHATYPSGRMSTAAAIPPRR